MSAKVGSGSGRAAYCGEPFLRSPSLTSPLLPSSPPPLVLAVVVNGDADPEYDDEDQNLVVLRLPNAAQKNGKSFNGNQASTPPEVEQEGDDDEDWVDESEESEEDPEALEAVDRVLKKYDRAKVVDEEEEDFDVRHDRAIQERMDEWKRGYYRVSRFYLHI